MIPGATEGQISAMRKAPKTDFLQAGLTHNLPLRFRPAFTIIWFALESPGTQRNSLFFEWVNIRQA
jgi:hypothetical protein